jgi:hypothetical protein
VFVGAWCVLGAKGALQGKADRATHGHGKRQHAERNKKNDRATTWRSCIFLLVLAHGDITGAWGARVVAEWAQGVCEEPL